MGEPEWDVDAVLAAAPQRLAYSIHSASGVYASFHPRHILTDDPHSDTSRWTAPPPDHRRTAPSSARTTSTAPAKRRRAPEWILLELDHVALVRTIGFGKTSKPHPCNLADFTLWGGLHPDPLAMEPLVDATLNNDAVPERLPLPVSLGTAPLPVRYLKIDCHAAANPAYSISIWHVFLEGYLPRTPALPCSTATLEQAYTTYKAQQTTHLVLAHLRRAGPATLPAYHALSALPAARGLEHPLLETLHDALVCAGDYPRAELVLEQIRAQGLLDEHAPGGGKGASVARWTRLHPGAGAGGAAPCGRGGHALVRVGRQILLYGGWDGTRDLGDLWAWDLHSGAGAGGWRCLDPGGEERDGPPRPAPRSCHQMAVDDREGWVYLLGGRRDELDEDKDDEDGARAGAGAMDVDGTTHPSEPGAATEEALGRALSRLQRRADRWKSDFWRYKAVGPARGTWECLSEDTRRDGGPALLFDHAMAVHSSAGRLFVFGGKNQPYNPQASPSGVADDAGFDSGVAGGAGTRDGRYSGMWSYDIAARRWTHLFGDPRPSTFTPRPASPSSSERLLSRAGHALVLDESSPGDPTLFILHGQRNEQYLADEWAVRLASASGSSSSAAGASAAAEPGTDTDASHWRQGAVLDFPSAPSISTAGGSLVDLSTLPASLPSAVGTRQPTIVQIRRLPAPTGAAPGPPAGFTQRLALGSRGAWVLLTGLASAGGAAGGERDRERERERERERAQDRGEGEERCVRGVWRRVGGAGGTWELVGGEEGGARGGKSEEEGGEGPRGRYAAQIVFDPLEEEYYLFGGCPEAPLPSERADTRLGDLWKLKIVDPTPDEALRKAKFLVRKQRFSELCATAPTVLALQYLQNDLAAVVDHSTPAESAAFRACMSTLLAAPPRMNVDADSALASASRPATPAGEGDREPVGEGEGEGVGEGTYAARHALWEELGRFVPRAQRQPDERLEDAGRLLRVWEMGGWGALGA